jgi:hypothetical protein
MMCKDGDSKAARDWNYESVARLIAGQNMGKIEECLSVERHSYLRQVLRGAQRIQFSHLTSS